MTAPATRLFGVLVLLFAVLAGATSWWTVWGANDLEQNPKNKRELIESLKIRRGTITARDGTTIARSRLTRDEIYTRRYPVGGLFSHAIGYSYTNLGRSGLEQSRNDELTGEDTELGTLLERLTGGKREGDDVRTTLDPDGQRAALDALRSAEGGRGAVVAIEPETGAVRVMASVPDFDPNEVPRRFKQLNRDKLAPLFNRATQSGYPPGSTFKVVTATAALDSGDYTPDSTVNGDSPKEISGVPLRNTGDESFGDITLTEALTQSVNTVWAQVAEDVGKRTMARYMDRFGFGRRPPLDYPRDQLRASGEYARGCSGKLLEPTDDRVDVGRMGIGQDKLCVTPLQMAMVAAAVANGGRLMEPRLTDRVVDRDGRVVDDVDPETQSRVMSRGTAEELTQMMKNVVKEGSGTQAALAGIEAAGKTGTAEIDVENDIAQAWFIGFAPADDPEIAIAVTVERTQGGFGGTVAAPIFKQVAEALLQ